MEMACFLFIQIDIQAGGSVLYIDLSLFDDFFLVPKTKMQARFNLWLEPSRNEFYAATRLPEVIRIGQLWPRLPASLRVATRNAIGEHPETRSSSLPRGCRVLSIASPVNTHLPVQARERTALNRQNATSLLTIPYQGEGSTRPFIFAHSPFTRALGGNASARLVRIAHYPCPLLCTCDTIQEKASAPRIHPITISRALQVKASTRVHRLCSNLLLKGSARFVCLNQICSLLSL